jgi:hypothetical protein
MELRKLPLLTLLLAACGGGATSSTSPSLALPGSLPGGCAQPTRPDADWVIRASVAPRLVEDPAADPVVLRVAVGEGFLFIALPASGSFCGNPADFVATYTLTDPDVLSLQASSWDALVRGVRAGETAISATVNGRPTPIVYEPAGGTARRVALIRVVP